MEWLAVVLQLRGHFTAESWLQIFLSGRGFIHRDLAARNILLKGSMAKVLSSHNQCKSYVQISDFGLCRHIDELSLPESIEHLRLPAKWLALEALQRREFSIRTDVFVKCHLYSMYANSAHRWSYGVVLYEIVSLGTQPYVDVSVEDMRAHLEEGHRQKAPSCCDEDMCAFFCILHLCSHFQCNANVSLLERRFAQSAELRRHSRAH